MIGYDFAHHTKTWPINHALMESSPYRIACCDCLDGLRQLPDKSVDLVFGSPPYEDARLYGIGFRLKGQAWVDWMVERWREMQRVSRGLVAMVVAGRTRCFKWSGSPVLLQADLIRAGFKLRNPPIYKRFGTSGSGGPDWLRSDYEIIVCTSHGRLPWSDNTACGKPPKCKPGGACSNRTRSGARVKPRAFTQPKIANPGNVIDCGAVGGGNMGSPFAHDNEAAFPLRLAEFFVRSFCPPGGFVLDPFCGSGTTLEAAVKWGRRGVGMDVRQDQIDLTRKRIEYLLNPQEMVSA